MSQVGEGGGDVAGHLGGVLATREPEDGQCAAGSQELTHPLERSRRIHVVERCDADDEIERRGLKGEGQEIAEEVLDVRGRVSTPGEFDALPVDVDCQDVGNGSAQFRRQDALAAVAQMDLSAFFGPYRCDGHGCAAHDPAMMVAPDEYQLTCSQYSQSDSARAVRRLRAMSDKSEFSSEQARVAGERVGIDWATSPFDVEQFRMGMDVELEHGTQDLETNVTDDDVTVTAKIARAHLNEFPDYYSRLAVMEAEAEAYWASKGA
jgi:hypothetical protein